MRKWRRSCSNGLIRNPAASKRPLNFWRSTLPRYTGKLKKGRYNLNDPAPDVTGILYCRSLIRCTARKSFLSFAFDFLPEKEPTPRTTDLTGQMRSVAQDECVLETKPSYQGSIKE